MKRTKVKDYKIGDVLKKLRKERGLTQAQLAEKVGLSKTAIFQYENNKREPNFDAITKLVKFFNVSPQYLAGKSEYKNMSEHVFMTDTVNLGKTIRDFPEDIRKQIIAIYNSFNDLIIKIRDYKRNETPYNKTEKIKEEQLRQISIVQSTIFFLNKIISGSYLLTKEMWIDGAVSEMEFYKSIRTVFELRLRLWEKELDEFFDVQSHILYQEYISTFDEISKDREKIDMHDDVSREIRAQLVDELSKKLERALFGVHKNT